PRMRIDHVSNTFRCDSLAISRRAATIVTMRRSPPDTFSLFLAIVSLCLSLIFFALSFFALSIAIILPGLFHIPYSLIGLLFLLYPAHFVDKYFRAFRLRRRIAAARKSGLILCPTCGYDLR